MAHHRSYSKRSRESRKAMGDGVGDQPDDSDNNAAEDWRPTADHPPLPPDPAS